MQNVVKHRDTKLKQGRGSFVHLHTFGHIKWTSSLISSFMFFVLIWYSLVLMWFFGTINFESKSLHSQNTSVQGFGIGLFGMEKTIQFRRTNGRSFSMTLFWELPILGDLRTNMYIFCIGLKRWYLSMLFGVYAAIIGTLEAFVWFSHVIPNTTLLMLAPLHPLDSEKTLPGIQQLVIAGKAAGFLRTVIFYLTTSRTSEIPISYSIYSRMIPIYCKYYII